MILRRRREDGRVQGRLNAILPLGDDRRISIRVAPTVARSIARVSFKPLLAWW